jgi:hypothetical protein
MTTFAPNLSNPTPGGSVPTKKKLTAETSAIRDYVMGTDGRAQGESTVLLHVSHSNLKKTFFQVKLTVWSAQVAWFI